jgi:BlaI family penicillinase repressor
MGTEPTGDPDAPALPDAELDVLACLWRGGEATARELREALAESRPMSHASVATLLARLQDKGLVDRRKGKVGKAFVYRATDRPATGRRRVVKRMLERVFGGDSLALATTLFQTKPLEADELNALQQLVDKLREEKEGS